jgi:hypothetical protein
LAIYSQKHLRRFPEAESVGFFVVLIFWKGSAMEKGMCLGSIGVAGVVLLVFLMDIIVGEPFGGADSPFLMVDIFGILACAIVVYLGWNAYKDIR